MVATEDTAVEVPELPYRGIQPYRYVDRSIFFARDEETRDLLSLVVVYRGVMLYGGSGSGKSSLVNAGLLPTATRKGFQVERVRVQPRVGEELVVERILADERGTLLPSLFATDDSAPRIVLSTEAFRARLLEASESCRPLLIFDQFEEIVTLFEEAGERDLRRPIAELLVSLLRDDVMPVKLVFSFREDYLAGVKALLAAVPELVDHALRLSPPGSEQLPTIIRGAFERFPNHYEREFTPELAASLNEKLAARFGSADVSLSEVQTVCLRLWQSDDPEAVLESKGVQGLLEDYLGEELEAFPPELKGPAVALLGQMVTAAGTRNVISAESLIERVQDENKDLTEQLLVLALNRLESESRLVRRERRRDLYLYEITSEFLVPWISRRQAELVRLQDRRRLRRRILRTWVPAVSALIVVFAAIALVQRNNAVEASTVATSLALSIAADNQLESNPGASLLLSLAAYKTSPTPQARSSMISALDAVRRSGVSAILNGHQGPVSGVAFSLDGSTLASAGDDGKVVLWDAAHDYSKLTTLDSGQSAVYGVAFSPDGSTLAAGTDGKVVLWDAAHDYRKLTTLDTGQSTVNGVAFSPDGSTLAAAGSDGKVVLWDAAHDYTKLTALDSGQSAVNGVAFSPDGSTLAAAGDDGKVVLWDAAHDYSKLTALDNGQSAVLGVAFSPDGSTLAAAGTGGWVVLWDTAHYYSEPTTLDSGQSTVNGVAFSPDGSTLAAAGSEGKVALWDAAHDYGKLPALDSGQSALYGVAFSPDGSTLAAAGAGGEVVLWDAAHDYGKLPALDSGQSALYGVAFSPDGSTLAAAGAGGEVVLWDAAHDYGKLPALDSGQSAVNGVAFSPDGSTLAAAGSEGKVVLWDAAHDYGKLPPLDSGQSAVLGVAFSPDGHTLAAAGSDGKVVLWDAAHDYGKLPALDSGQSAVLGVAFSPDGGTLAAAGSGGEVVLWDAAHDYGKLPALDSGQGAVRGVAFSPDGSTLAAAGSEGKVVLWDAAHDYGELPALDSGQRAVLGVAFSPDGSTLAAAGFDGKVVLWDAAHDYGKLPPLDSGQRAVSGVAFSPDGSTLAAAGYDGKVRLWDFFWHDISDVEAKVCGLVHGNDTRAEWETLAPGLPYSTTCPD